MPDAAPVHEAVVSVNGVDLYTRSIGSGPDVVVLHGGPGAHHNYLLPHVEDFDAFVRVLNGFLPRA
jgi:pimeloyl-ACP methyl ester carboxylesterase